MEKFRSIFSKCLQYCERIKPELFFMVVSLIFGIIYAAITPPFQTPDEPVHFLRAYQISTGNLSVDKINESSAGGILPSSLGVTIDRTFGDTGLPFRPDVKYDSNITKDALDIKDDGQMRQYDFGATKSYSPLSYLPQAIGIGIARMFDASPVVMMYAARIGSLVAWVLLIGLAIRTVPYKKWFMVAVGLLPMAVFQSVSCGVDVVTIASLTLLVSQVLQLREKERGLDIKRGALLFLTLVALVLSKQIMFLFIPLILLIPKSSYSDKRFVWLKRSTLVVAPILIYAGWTLITSDIPTAAVPQFNPQPSQQIKFILERPLSYISVLWRTNFFINSDGITRSFVGTFGWMDTPLSEWIVMVGYIGLVLLLVIRYDEPKKKNHQYKYLSVKEKWFIVALLGAFWLAIMTALYVFYTPLKYKIIIGVQGRYFLPAAALLIPLFMSSKNKLFVKKRHYVFGSMLFSVTLLLAGAITIFYRYYIVY